MSLNIGTVRNFFDTPHYLDNSRYLIKIRSMLIKELLGNVDANNKLLDIGCGDGSLSIPLIGDTNTLTMVDLSPKMLQIVKERLSQQVRQRTILVNCPIDDFEATTPFDIILCVGVLAHVPSIESAIAKISNSLALGGKTVLEFAPNPNPWRKFFLPYFYLRELLSGSITGYSTNKVPIDTLLKIASKYGLELVQQRRYGYPVPTMGRWTDEQLYRFTYFTLTNPFMSKIGTEHLLVFNKIA